SRTADVKALADRLKSPFLAGYVDVLADAQPFPVVLGGQEFTEALQQQLEAIQYGRATAAEAQKNAQTDATEILERAGK
ncbi:MAG TPA: sugar ABC transporter substrate-binding protein, partial [Bauldia sp.]|nr:sugar ABC transporter substrate-binding protein [Bauldia sp.]